MSELGQAPGEVVLFGIEPASIEPGLELSPLLAERLDETSTPSGSWTSFCVCRAVRPSRRSRARP
jgi:hypothetical protein